jgi:SAM-dependent methyltransferase
MDDEFIDIGCGKGRVLAIAATYPGRSVLGVEYERALANLAKLNIAKINVSRPVYAKMDVHQGAAEDFDYSNITVAYAYNPVEPDVLDVILAKIKRDRMNRPFRMAYIMESPAQRAIFASHSWLERYDGFTNSANHVISFYRSIPDTHSVERSAYRASTEEGTREHHYRDQEEHREHPHPQGRVGEGRLR